MNGAIHIAMHLAMDERKRRIMAREYESMTGQKLPRMKLRETQRAYDAALNGQAYRAPPMPTPVGRRLVNVAKRATGINSSFGLLTAGLAVGSAAIQGYRGGGLQGAASEGAYAGADYVLGGALSTYADRRRHGDNALTAAGRGALSFADTRFFGGLGQRLKDVTVGRDDMSRQELFERNFFSYGPSNTGQNLRRALKTGMGAKRAYEGYQAGADGGGGQVSDNNRSQTYASLTSGPPIANRQPSLSESGRDNARAIGTVAGLGLGAGGLAYAFTNAARLSRGGTVGKILAGGLIAAAGVGLLRASSQPSGALAAAKVSIEKGSYEKKQREIAAQQQAQANGKADGKSGGSKSTSAKSVRSLSQTNKSGAAAAAKVASSQSESKDRRLRVVDKEKLPRSSYLKVDGTPSEKPLTVAQQEAYRARRASGPRTDSGALKVREAA